jgi:hypothetical protein
MNTLVIDGLEDSFDNDSSEKMLELSVGRLTHTSDLVRKSMYDFDLTTPEGIEKLMSLLPIMDSQIVKDIMSEIWPGYSSDADSKSQKMEIKGYLKDYLESYDEQEALPEQETPEFTNNARPDAIGASAQPGAEDEA